jgi:ribosomal protein L36
MRYRTARRKLAREERAPRIPSPFTGLRCFICCHYARRVESKGRVQVICNSNGAHKG